jgi:hypothetical protein
MSYNLLSVGADAKTIKGNGDEYITAIQYMASYKTVWEGKVHNLCAMAEKAKCHEGLLSDCWPWSNVHCSSWSFT